jgi:hypothetical protein
MRDQPKLGIKHYKWAIYIFLLLIISSILGIIILVTFEIELVLTMNILTAILFSSIFALIVSLIGWHDLKKHIKNPI